MGGGLPGAPICFLPNPSGWYEGFVPAGRFGGYLANGLSTLSFLRFFPSSACIYAEDGGVGFGGGRDIVLLLLIYLHTHTHKTPSAYHLSIYLYSITDNSNNNHTNTCCISTNLIKRRYVYPSRMN